MTLAGRHNLGREDREIHDDQGELKQRLSETLEAAGRLGRGAPLL